MTLIHNSPPFRLAPPQTSKQCAVGDSTHDDGHVLGGQIRIASALLGGPLARGGGIQLGVGLGWVGRSRIGYRWRIEACGSVYYTYADNFEQRESCSTFSTTEGTQRIGPDWSDGITQL